MRGAFLLHWGHMIPWRAHDALFKLTTVGLGLAAFSALLAIATVTIQLSSRGQLLILQRPAQATTVTPAGPLTTSVVDQLCYSDADCTVVASSCVACGCGAPVNVIYAPRYQAQWQALCQGQPLVGCGAVCPTPYPRCLGGRCALSEIPPAPPPEP